MSNETAPYLEKSYTENVKSIATFLMIGSLLSPGSLGAIEHPVMDEVQNCETFWVKNIGSDIHNKAYRLPKSTWSFVDNALDFEVSPTTNRTINATESLGVVNNFAFLSVDEEIDSKIEHYFAAKPIKTKTIFVNSRIKQG